MSVYTTLISAADLHAQLHNPDWRIFDCRFDLGQPEQGWREYLEEHIPGAHYAHLDKNLSALRTADSGRHPLPEIGVFAAWLGQQGVDENTQVIAYDHASGAFAARLWWLLRWLGHDRVAVLDGGMAAWRKAAYPVTKIIDDIPPKKFTPCPRADVHVSAAELLANRSNYLLLDARSASRFRGEVEPIDPVAGHIPGACNHDFNNNLDADQHFKSREYLKNLFAEYLADTPADKTVCMCGSGVTACHNLLAMTHAGFSGMKLYPGSWSEWITDPRRPISKTVV